MKRLVNIILPFVVAATTLVSCGGNSAKNSVNSTGELKGEISLSGAFALYPLAVVWADEFQKANPGVKVDVSAGGAGKGMTDVLAGVVDFGMVSREVYPQEQEKGAIGFASAKDAVVPTINAANPIIDKLLAHGITKEIAHKIWVEGNVKTWGDVLGTDDQTPIHIYTRSDACGAAETFANWFGAKQEDLGGTAVFGDPGLAAAIQSDIYGIGFNNIGYAYDNDSHQLNAGLQIFPVDVDGNGSISADEQFYAKKEDVTKAIADGKYPSPPARDLYLVSKGVPTDPVLVAFLKYVLTDGQKKNEPVGYIEIPQEKIEKSLKLLEEKK
ncbi:MAG: PstS family phosphate ABC transporter substrate-binding protein [Bacteroidales bacterium]|nr:PstS family phosphate ABC transporter substrate-binding protein [Bacteroidales bacterium]